MELLRGDLENTKLNKREKKNKEKRTRAIKQAKRGKAQTG